MIFELCKEYVMESYVYDVIICHMMSDNDIVVKLHHIGRHNSAFTVIVMLNCVAKH